MKIFNNKLLELIDADRIKNERIFCKRRGFKTGEHLYMGMALFNGKDNTVCISVSCKIDPCIKEAKRFVKLNEDPNSLVFYKINKVRSRDLKLLEEFFLTLQK